jgi:hypothetical protein
MVQLIVVGASALVGTILLVASAFELRATCKALFFNGF